MKIVIVGPGAIGCLFAFMFARTEQHEVWLLDKDKERSKILSKKGITLEGVGTLQSIQSTSTPIEIGTADLILICVKSYDTESASHSIIPIVSRDTNVLTLQNGLNNAETIAEIIDEGNIIAGVTSHGATLVDTGYIRHAGIGKTIIGLYKDRGSEQNLTQVKDALSSAGIETDTSQDIYSVIWGKLIINSAINPITALTRLKNGQLLIHEHTRKLLKDVASESALVANFCQIQLPYDDPVAAVEETCRLTSQNVSSMLQDVLRSKRTEIDAINGAIVKRGIRVGIKTPINMTLMSLVKGLEASNIVDSSANFVLNSNKTG